MKEKKAAIDLAIYTIIINALVILSACDRKNDRVKTDIPPKTSEVIFQVDSIDNAGISELVFSSPTAVTGIKENEELSISISNGEYSINGAEFTTQDRSIRNNDSIVIRLLSSDRHLSLKTAFITIEKNEYTFNVTTIRHPNPRLGPDTSPDMLFFNEVKEAPLSQYVYSSSETIKGINGISSVYVYNGEYSVNQGSYTSEVSEVKNGDTIRLRVISSSLAEKSTVGSVEIGYIMAIFKVTTGLKSNLDGISDKTPDNFTFNSLDKVDLSSQIYSNPVHIEGIDGLVKISISYGEYSINGGEFTSTPGLVSDGDTIIVRIISPHTHSESTTSSITVGTYSATFTVSTIDPPTPNQQCLFDLEDISENSTININCIYDLKGNNLTLNDNIDLAYAGGDIINGILTLSNGKIDGELLNYTLTVNGSANITNPTYTFAKHRWNIIENSNNEDIAISNKGYFRKLIKQLKDLNANTLKIESLDVYVQPSYYTRHPISNAQIFTDDAPFELPSNFTLDMTNDVHIRVYKNDSRYYELIRIGNGDNRSGALGDSFTDVNNVIVKGGNLIGDREDHIYSPEGGAHEYGRLIALHHAEDIVIDGVNFVDASGDGLLVDGYQYPGPDHQASKNVTIKNCTFDRNRRNHISISHAYNTIIDNNNFFNSKVNLVNSNYVSPSSPIYVRPSTSEEVYDVKIVNNSQEGKGNFYIYSTTPMPIGYTSPSPYVSTFVIDGADSGGSIIIENNSLDGSLLNRLGNGIRARHNTLSSITTGYALAYDDTAQLFDNIFHDNTIDGSRSFESSASGILATGRGSKIHSNTVQNVTSGIHIGAGVASGDLGGLKDTDIYSNTVTANQNGLSILNGVGNVSIYSNDIKVDSYSSGRSAVKSINVNSKVEYSSFSFDITNNLLKGYEGGVEKSYVNDLSNVSGLTFEMNDLNGWLSLKELTLSDITDNNIVVSDYHGIYIQEDVSDTDISTNTITVKKDTGSPYECIHQKSGTSPGVNLSISGNTCNILLNPMAFNSNQSELDPGYDGGVDKKNGLISFDNEGVEIIETYDYNTGLSKLSSLGGKWEKDCTAENTQNSKSSLLKFAGENYISIEHVFSDASCFNFIYSQISCGRLYYDGLRILPTGQIVMRSKTVVTSRKKEAYSAADLDVADLCGKKQDYSHRWNHLYNTPALPREDSNRSVKEEIFHIDGDFLYKGTNILFDKSNYPDELEEVPFVRQ